MAILTLNLDVPDAKIDAFRAALDWHRPHVDQDGNDLGPRTVAQGRALLEDMARAAARDMYHRHQVFLRDQAAIDEITIS